MKKVRLVVMALFIMSAITVTGWEYPTCEEVLATWKINPMYLKANGGGSCGIQFKQGEQS